MAENKTALEAELKALRDNGGDAEDINAVIIRLARLKAEKPKTSK